MRRLGAPRACHATATYCEPDRRRVRRGELRSGRRPGVRSDFPIGQRPRRPGGRVAQRACSTDHADHRRESSGSSLERYRQLRSSRSGPVSSTAAGAAVATAAPRSPPSVVDRCVISKLHFTDMSTGAPTRWTGLRRLRRIGGDRSRPNLCRRWLVHRVLRQTAAAAPAQTVSCRRRRRPRRRRVSAPARSPVTAARVRRRAAWCRASSATRPEPGTEHLEAGELHTITCCSVQIQMATGRSRPSRSSGGRLVTVQLRHHRRPEPEPEPIAVTILPRRRSRGQSLSSSPSCFQSCCSSSLSLFDVGQGRAGLHDALERRSRGSTRGDREPERRRHLHRQLRPSSALQPLRRSGLGIDPTTIPDLVVTGSCVPPSEIGCDATVTLTYSTSPITPVVSRILGPSPSTRPRP